VTQRRLPWLLALLAAMLAVRWWDWSDPSVPPAASAAVSRPRVSPTPAAVHPLVATREPMPPARGGWPDMDAAAPRNAFAVRLPPVPASPPAAQPAQVATAAPLAPALPPTPVEPPQPAPPLQVIGSWLDDKGSSVFLAGPRSTVQARVGDVLLAEYRVTRITPQEVVLRHLPSNRDAHLAVPLAAGRLLK
jgi:hypothetical protein